MTRPFYITIDDQGRANLPPEWGLQPGDRLRVEPVGSGSYLHPSITTLQRVYVEITNRCNLTCSTCIRNVWDVEYGNMPEETFERVLTGAQAVSPKPELFIGGYGEPLAHPGCLSMLKRAKSLGFRVSMITNGILLTEGVSRKLIEVGLDMLWISLDGASPESYADVRLGDALPTILENLKRYRSLQFQILNFYSWEMLPRLGIAFVAMRRNIQDLPAVIKLGEKLGAVEYSITNVLAHNPALRDESLYWRRMDKMGSRAVSHWHPVIHMPLVDITPATAPVIIELLKKGQNLDLFGSWPGQNGDRCPFVERGSLSVRWDGKVSPCLPLLYDHTYYLDDRLRTSKAYFIGNIQDRELLDIWNDAGYLGLRKLLQDFDFSPCTVCNSCEMADSNLEDCFGNSHPACGGCLWAQGLIRCP